MKSLYILIGLSIALLLINIFIFNSVPELEMTTAIFGIHIYMFVLFVGIHVFLKAYKKKAGNRFVTAFMGISGFKLLFSLGVAAVYLYLNRGQAIVFGITFAALYMFYTTISTVLLLKEFK